MPPDGMYLDGYTGSHSTPIGLATPHSGNRRTCETITVLLSLQNLRRQYQSGAASPEDIVRSIYDRIKPPGTTMSGSIFFPKRLR